MRTTLDLPLNLLNAAYKQAYKDRHHLKRDNKSPSFHLFTIK
jgi:hypothetical protein